MTTRGAAFTITAESQSDVNFPGIIRQKRKVLLVDPEIMDETIAKDEAMDAADLANLSLRKAKLMKAIPQLPNEMENFVRDFLAHGEPPRVMAKRLGVRVEEINNKWKVSKRRLRELMGVPQK